MTHFRRVVPLAVLVSVCLAATDARAVVDLCARGKVLAAAKASKSYLICKGVGATDGDVTACQGKAAGKMDAAFTKANTKSVCRGTSPGCQFVADQCVSSAAELIPAECKKLAYKAAAKLALGLLKCSANYYKGKTAVDTSTCQAKAAGKFDAVTGKLIAKTGCALNSAALKAIVTSSCAGAVLSGLSDTARICERCCQTTQIANVTPPAEAPEALGCSDGSAEIVVQGCATAAAQYAALTDIEVGLAEPDSNFCDGGSGSCVAVTATPSEDANQCCQLMVTEADGDHPACAQGPISIDGVLACASVGGTISGSLQQCEDGQTCVDVAP